MTRRSQTGSPKCASSAASKMRWRSGSSIVAAAFLLASAPQVAQAQAFTPVEGQAFQANASSPTGGVLFLGPRTTNLDQMQISQSEVMINWTPLDTNAATFDSNGLVDNPINILPSGRTLRFVSDGLNYTVLNRILPVATADGRPVQFNGTVESFIDTGGTTSGGNIWFYSPGGIIAGAASRFDVGGLVLTSNDIDTGSGFFGSGGEIRFRGIADSNSRVEIAAGAQINALNNGSSYVALVAPRVVQGGNVNVDGSVAYVGAEQADLTINSGLFDISIGLGTTDGNGVVHSGTTTGPSSTPIVDGGGSVTDADAQAIYMVAVPKNDALTMLVGGNLGYQAAASASIVNGNVVLSAGANVAVTGDQTNTSFAFDRAAADSDANIQLQDATFGSSVSAFSTNGIIAATTNSSDSIITDNSQGTQNLSLEARNQIDLNARGGGDIRANGNIILRAGSAGVGGTINIDADQLGFASPTTSGLIATGNLVVDASASGLDDFDTVRNNGGTGIGQDATGGTINIDISGDGDIVVGGTAQFNVTAQGGKGESQNGSGQGGNINLNISSGTFNVTGTTFLDSHVIDAQSLKIGGNGPGLLGSSSIAGDISLNFSGGAVTTGAMFVGLGAIATKGEVSGGAQSHSATGGVFELVVTGGNHLIDELEISAIADAEFSSFDGAGTTISGSANSGSASFLIDGGSLSINSDLTAYLDTYGLSIANPANRATLTAQNSGVLTVGGQIYLSTMAFNGNNSAINTGGSISVVTDNATINTGGLVLDSSARPNDLFFFALPDEGKDFQAGDINLVARNGGSFTSGLSFLSATATGNDLISGSGTGGNILVHSNDGSIAFTNDVSINASGVGGVGGSSDNPESLGIGRGGAVDLRVEGTSGSLSFTNLDVNSDGSINVGGEGGAPRFEGDGGLGFGGNVTFDLLGGIFTATNITVGSGGSGGGGGDLLTLPGSSSASMIGPLALPEDLSVAAAPFAGGTSAGDGGDGQGGDVVFNLNGGNATVTNLTIAANGFGGDGANGNTADGTAGGNGGRGIGGNATFNAQSGNLTVTNTLTVSAEGNNQIIAPYGSAGRGGYGNGTDAGSGGDGIGGTAVFNLDGSATINAGNIVVSTSADGGRGGNSSSTFDGLGNPVQAGIGGNGGNATGGNATFNNNAGTLGFSQLSVTSVGTGGNGGNIFGFSTGEADNVGGNGGTGTGGNATININQDDLNNPVYIVDAGGIGGDGGEGLDGGNGGAAFGGVAAININDATADPDDPTIVANATGGAGGQGLRDSATNITGNSGDGGNATGGTARLQVTGAGGNIDLGFVILEANASGGNGAPGFYQFGGGIEGGDGGSGGNATGGTVELIARTGGTLTLASSDFTMTSTGTGGNGGNGGNSYDSNAGDAGDGGDATGGTGRLLAQGGTISGNNLVITTAGLAGDGGTRGIYGVFGTNGADGTGGTGTGGTGIIEVQEGSPGILTFANVTMNANGTGGGGPIAGFGAGGRIEISDSSTDPAGLITINRLTATAFDTAIGTGSGSASAPLGGFFTTANSGAVTILGNLNVDVAGNIEYDLVGDAQMTVSGDATLTSGQNILIDHSNNITPVNSIDVSNEFTATAQGNFISTDGSRINAGGRVTVRAEQNATVTDIAGVDLVDISALQNATVNNAAVTGTPIVLDLGAGQFLQGPQLNVQAGLDPTGSPSPTPTPTPSYDPNFDATITGDLTSTGRININAGGNAIFTTGSSTVSDNGLTVQTGDDIIIQSGASLVAADNPATTPSAISPFSNANNLLLQAGSLTPLISTPLTPIASIVAAGDINANGFAVVMTANAIDGLGGTITASSISVDINNAPANGVTQSDDDGLLSAQCVEGNICLGTLDADNLVYIGQASNNDVIQAIVESGTVVANEILVTTRRDIVMGTTGIATVLDASNQFLVESTEGNVDLRDASVSSGSILVSAVNGSLLGSGSLVSNSDIGITVGADINAALIDTDGQLTTIALVGGDLENSYSVPGNINVGTLTQAGDIDIDIDAGGDISFGQINLPANRSITLTASSGDAFLGSNSSAASISIVGNNVGFGSLQSSGDIMLDAISGDLTGSGPGDLTAGGAINLNAAGNIDFGNLDALGGEFTADAGGGVTFQSSTSGGGTTIVADFVSIGSAATADIGQSINLFANDVTADTLTTNSGDILVSAAQNIALGSAATGSGTPTAGSIGLLAGGNINSTGTFNAGEDVAIRALGNVALTTVIAGDDVTVQADGAISLANATTSGTGIDLFALSFDSSNAGQAGSIAFGSETVAGSDIQLDSGSDVNATGTLNADDDINITATGTPTVANAISGSDTSITGASVTLNNGSIGGDLTLNALAGDVDGNGTVIVGGGIDLDATGNAGFGDLDAQGGTFTVDAGGNINFAASTSSSGTFLNAGGNIDGGDITSDGDIVIDGNNDANLGSVNSANSVSAQLLGAFVASDVTASAGLGEVDISADNGIEIANVAGNDIFLTAATGLVNVTNNVDVTNSIIASGEAVSITTQQDTSVGAEATNGNVVLSSAGGLRIQDTQASGNISMNADDDILVDGAVNAVGQLLITAGGLIDVQAATVGGTIQTVSADMNIGTSGSLGQSGLTNDIRISSDGTTQMVLGGATDPTGVFSLNNDEFSRIQSGGDLTIFAAATGLSGFDLTVQDLSASAFSNGNFGTDGNFNIFADQSIRVDGRLSVEGDLDTNLRLAAGDDLFVNAETGSIGIGNDSDLSGNLSLTARNIYAMTDQAFADIQGLGTAGIDARLAQNDGNVRDNGFIVANAISVTLLASQFYVQNTGSGTDFDARRGFVAGAGGLAINTGPSGITPIVINGTVNGATGIPAIPATTITGAGFNAASTINGCVINNPASCGGQTQIEVPGLNDPVQDVIEEEVTPENYENDPLDTNIIEIKKNEGFVDEPLIDEPVTGAGNDDLWAEGSDCGEDGEENCQTDEADEELEPVE